MKNLLFTMLLLGSVFAANWTLSGDSVSWANGNFSIVCTPIVSNELIHHTQYCNFTSIDPNSLTTNLTFVFDQSPINAAASLWQNYSHNVITPTIVRVGYYQELDNINSNSASSLPCDIGDKGNTYSYKVNYTSNGSNISVLVVCFNTYVQNGSNYTFHYFVNETQMLPQMKTQFGWKDIGSAFSTTGVAGKRTYTAKDYSFSAGTVYQMKFDYDMDVNSYGKFSIYMHGGSPQNLFTNDSIYVALDPWYNASWGYAIPIDINTTVATDLANFPARVSLNTSNSTLWNTTTCTNVRFLDSLNTTVLNYDLDDPSNVFCGNATNNATFWVSGNYTGGALTRIYAYLGNTGAASGENSSAVWTAGNYTTVYHGNDLTDELGVNNLTAQGTFTTITNSTQCKIGTCFSFPSSTAYGQKTSATHPTGGRTVSGFFWASALTNSMHLGDLGTQTSGNGDTFLYSTNQLYWGTYAQTSYPISPNITATNFTAITYAGYKILDTNHITGVYGTTFTNATSAYPTAITSGVINVGGYSYNWGKAGLAAIDEYRIANVVHSDDWMTAESSQLYLIGIVGNNTNSNITPAIIIQSPTNSTYNITNISLNYTVSNQDSCWYSLNGGANVSLGSCVNTSILGVEGGNSITVYVNSSTNTLNSSTVGFTVDSITPNVSIQSPTNTAYNSINILLRFTATDANLDKCWYSLNGTNVSLPGCNNITFAAPQGANTIIVFANDTFGNKGNDTVSFTVNSTPNVSIQSPTNTAYNSINILLRFTAISGALDSCWYSLNGSNVSLPGCNNITIYGFSNGTYNITVYSNDTLNNTGSANVSFSIAYYYSSMVNGIENPMGVAIGQIIGDASLVGIIILAFFAGWVAVSGMKNDAKIMVLTIAGFLAFALLPNWTMQIFVIFAGFILGAAILKIFNRW